MPISYIRQADLPFSIRWVPLAWEQTGDLRVKIKITNVLIPLTLYIEPRFGMIIPF